MEKGCEGTYEVVMLHERHDVQSLDMPVGTASCGNSSFCAEVSTMTIVRRRKGVDVRASTSGARYPCPEMSESETHCTGRTAIACSGTTSA